MSSTSAASDPGERIEYPVTRRSDHVDDYHGTAVPDPYDWLENPDSPETTAWVEAQNAVTQRFLSGSADRPLLKQRLLSLYNYERYSCPFHRGSRYFFFHNGGLQNQSVLYKQETLDAAETVLLDPNTLSEDGTAALGTYAFSEDGQWLAYGVSRSGSDWQTIELLRVDDGALQAADSLRWVKFSSIAWTHDHAGFFYSRYPTPASFVGVEEDADHRKGSETDKLEHHSVYYHRLHSTQAEDVLVFATAHQPKWMNSAEVSDDGRFLVLSISESTEPVNRLYFYPLPESLSFDLQSAIPESAICRLVDTFDNEFSYITNEGGRFFFKTNLQAPRYRIVSTDVDSWTAGRAEAAAVQWTEVIEHKEDVLSFVSCVNQTELVAVYLHNVSECIHLYGLDGNFRSTIDMPDLGCVAGLSGRKKDSRGQRRVIAVLAAPVVCSSSQLIMLLACCCCLPVVGLQTDTRSVLRRSAAVLMSLCAWLLLASLVLCAVLLSVHVILASRHDSLSGPGCLLLLLSPCSHSLPRDEAERLHCF